MVDIQTNDPNHPSLQLVVTGKVEKFVDIRPSTVHLEGRAGSPLAVEVEIQPNKDHPFTILGVQTQRNDLIRCKLVEKCGKGKNRCILRVENLQTTSGTYTDTITVRTDNIARPSFTIGVVGTIH
jgi:hypothetical protein